MSERVLVTIKYHQEEHDFDLPLNARLEEYSEDLDSLIQDSFRTLSPDSNIFLLGNESGCFSEECALNDYGVHDGTVILLTVL